MSVNTLNKTTRELMPFAGVPIGKLNLLETKTNNIANDTDVYSEQKSYSVGDYVIYDNVVYKCITACTANTWENNASNFESTTLLGISNELKNALNDEISIIPNGTETWTQAYNRLYALIPSGRVYNILEITTPDNGAYLISKSYLEVKTANVLTYIRNMGSASAITIYKEELSSLSAKTVNQSANGGTITVTNQGSLTCSASKITLKNYM